MQADVMARLRLLAETEGKGHRKSRYGQWTGRRMLGGPLRTRRVEVDLPIRDRRSIVQIPSQFSYSSLSLRVVWGLRKSYS